MTDEDIALQPEVANAPTFEFLGSKGFHEFVRYLLASAAALVIDAGLLWVLTSVFAVPYLISGAIGFVVGLCVIYVLSILWVFEERRFKSFFVEFGAFALIGLSGLALNEFILWAVTAGIGWHYLAAKCVSVFAVFTWNFSARRLFLFRKV